MLIPHEFDEAKETRRKRIASNLLRTADKLNNRMNNFLLQVDRNSEIKASDKLEIKNRLLNQLSK